MDLVNHLEGRLLFAVPKKLTYPRTAEGRLQQPTLSLLEGSDIQFRRETRLDIALVKNLPLALIFLPAADIPTFVGEGRVDLGITGLDQVAEHDAIQTKQQERGTDGEAWTEVNGDASKREGLDVVMDLGFGRCKLQVQVPEKGSIEESKDLVGKNIVTSFVGLTEGYFANIEAAAALVSEGAKKHDTRIRYVGGSVEAACALGVADGIVDLVESGETMKAAGLKPIDTVLVSTAVLIKSKQPSKPSLVDLIASRIKGVITAQKYILCQYNIPRPLLSKAAQITPGKRAPTVTALDDPDWVAVSSMVEKDRIAIAMDELTAAGASDILCLGILNSRTV